MDMTQKQKMINQIIYAANRLGFSDAYSIFKGYCGSQVVILMYHRVESDKNGWLLPPISTTEFESQMRYLSKTHKILPLNKLAEYLREGRYLDKKVAVVTFDDGYKDNYNNAFPILKKYDVPATVFLVTGHIGSENLFWFDKIRYLIWNTKLKKIELDGFGDFSFDSKFDRLNSIFMILEKFKKISNEKKNHLVEELVNIFDVDIPRGLGKDVILSWDEVKEMSENGIDFGAHTVTHPILTRTSSDQTRFEIMQSKKDIEKRLDKPVDTFCYPNGTSSDFNKNLIDLLKENGFTCAVTTIPALRPSKMNLYKLGRLPTAGSYESFKFFVSGCYSDASNILNHFRRSNVQN